MRDCASTLTLNPHNIKAFYRAALACLALDRLSEARDAVRGGLDIEPSNSSLLALRTRIAERDALIVKKDAERKAREEKNAAEVSALKEAFRIRNIVTRMTASPPDLEDAGPRLEESLDATSTLSLPVLVLYPLASQSDLIKAWDETSTIGSHLEYLLPAPWDATYTVDSVECYVGTKEGGLAKAGKKVALKSLLGRADVVDGLVSLYIVRKSEAEKWIAEWKVTRGVRR